VFRQDSKNEWLAIVEKLATAQAKEETTSSLRARDAGAPAAREIFPTPTGKKIYVSL
jgi:hypothetical protein